MAGMRTVSLLIGGLDPLLCQMRYLLSDAPITLTRTWLVTLMIISSAPIGFADLVSNRIGLDGISRWSDQPVYADDQLFCLLHFIG